MLSYERILSVFADYLAADTGVEVVQTRHGYAFLTWDAMCRDWESVESCPTPEALLDRLTSSVEMYEQSRLLNGMREPTDAECAVFAEAAEAYRRRCLEEQA